MLPGGSATAREFQRRQRRIVAVDAGMSRHPSALPHPLAAGSATAGSPYGLGPAVARRRDQPSAANTQRGSSHHALTPAACTSSAVSARAATTTAATRQSSPMTKSYQNAPI